MELMKINGVYIFQSGTKLKLASGHIGTVNRGTLIVSDSWKFHFIEGAMDGEGNLYNISGEKIDAVVEVYNA